MNKAEQVVATMLEGDFDQHVKAHQRVQKWDNAHRSFQELMALKAKSMDLFKQTGEVIGIEQALAHKGIERAEVKRFFRGAEIGAIDNYKGTVPAKICRDRFCAFRSLWGEGNTFPDSARAKFQSADLEACPGCGKPLELVAKSISPSELRGKYARHILGVELNDGHKVWFDKPVAPR